jgi:hypothetical protein
MQGKISDLYPLSALKSVTEKKKKRKRIHNPRTRKYYRVATRSGKKHKRGQILGRWSPE